MKKGKEVQKRVDKKKDEKIKEGQVVEDKGQEEEKIARMGRQGMKALRDEKVSKKY